MPLITRKGATFPGRVAASLLGAIGLSELVTDSAEEFEALAVKLASDPKALKKVRDKLAKNKSKSALFDTDRFRKNIEAAYTKMWERWLAGEKPKGFAVKARGLSGDGNPGRACLGTPGRRAASAGQTGGG